MSRLRDLGRPFEAEDIEWRIGRSGETNGKLWAKVLAYISARAIMERLDAVCGPENWCVTYRIERDQPVTPLQDKEGRLAGNPIIPGVIASIGIKTDHGWVYKEDGAEQTDIESFKGGLSGAVKRAAVAWGIGRYLYRLEEGYAEISMDRKPGFEWAKTKEGKQFYWKPPLLPAWALPTPEGYIPPNVFTKEPVIDRYAEVKMLQQKAKLQDSMIKEMITQYPGVKLLSELTDAQYGEVKAHIESFIH